MKKILLPTMVLITIYFGVSAQEKHKINSESFLCDKFWVVSKDTSKDETSQIMFRSDYTYVLSITRKDKKLKSDIICYGKWKMNGQYITISVECDGTIINQDVKVILLDDISLIVSYQNTLSFFMHPNRKQYAGK